MNRTSCIIHEPVYYTVMMRNNTDGNCSPQIAAAPVVLGLSIGGILVQNPTTVGLSPETPGKIGPHWRFAWDTAGGQGVPGSILSATTLAVVEELFPGDFDTVETEDHRFHEQTRSRGEEFGMGPAFTVEAFQKEQRLLLLMSGSSATARRDVDGRSPTFADPRSRSYGSQTGPFSS